MSIVSYSAGLVFKLVNIGQSFSVNRLNCENILLGNSLPSLAGPVVKENIAVNHNQITIYSAIL